MGDEVLHFLSEFFIGFNQVLMTTLMLIEALLELSMVVISCCNGRPGSRYMGLEYDLRHDDVPRQYQCHRLPQ